MNSCRSSRNPWPIAIIAYFIVFISAMTLWVFCALRQNMDLVSADYYEQEVRYQRQIDRLQATQVFQNQLAIAYDPVEQAIAVTLPAGHTDATGHIHLYRPSDARLDRHVALALAPNGVQQLDAKNLRPGLWKIRVQWAAAGREFFFDHSLVLPGGKS